MQRGRPHCPRCGNRLQRDYEVLSCIACGYEFVPAATDVEWRWLTTRRAAALMPLALLRGVSPWLTLAGVVILALAPVVASRLRRHQGTEQLR